MRRFESGMTPIPIHVPFMGLEAKNSQKSTGRGEGILGDKGFLNATSTHGEEV